MRLRNARGEGTEAEAGRDATLGGFECAECTAAVPAFRESLNSDSRFWAVTVTVTVRASAAGARSLAARIMVLAGVGIGVLFLIAWTRKDEATAHLFDCLHWTL